MIDVRSDLSYMLHDYVLVLENRLRRTPPIVQSVLVHSRLRSGQEASSCDKDRKIVCAFIHLSNLGPLEDRNNAYEKLTEIPPLHA